MHINIIYITLNYRYILCIEVAHTNYLASSLNIYTDKTLIYDSGVLFSHPSIDKKPYYSGGIFLNKSINLISIGL